MNYYLHILVMLEIYALLALSANQMIGTSGLLNLSHAVFYGLGAYTTSILTTQFGISYFGSWIWIPSVVLVVSLFYAYISSKVRELYFSLASLTIQVIFFSTIFNWINLTKGPYGIPGIGQPELFGYSISDPVAYSVFGFIVLAIAIGGFYFLNSSRLNLLIQATRDDEIALTNLGINPKGYRFTSIFISAFLAALAGSMYAGYTTYIDPTSFTLDESILILSIVLIGGIGSYKGAIIGAAIYVLLPELVKMVQIPDEYAANLRMVIFGLLLITIVRFRPKGILGKPYLS